MSKTLAEIAQQLKDTDKKVQLIYGFNGMGKTRLSREFKKLISPKLQEVEDIFEVEDVFEIGQTRSKILYYNAFTEDLFYWDNDLEADAEPKLKIQPNSFTDWILKDQGQEPNIIKNFQRYANDKLTPSFNPEYKVKGIDGKEATVPAFSEVTFSLERGDDTDSGKLKISKGEESNFIWSIFYALLDQVITILNVPELANRETDQFNQLKYVFIDDPVSSLDENHLIELAVNLAGLIKSSQSDLRFIITTHSPSFYNAIYSQLQANSGYILSRTDDGGFEIEEKKGASNTAFAYHLHIKNLIEQAVEQKSVQRHHFTLLRNLYEKTASFLGYKEWADLLDTAKGDKKAYLKLIMHFASHSRRSDEEIAEPTLQEKQTVKFLLDHLHHNYNYWPKQEAQNG